MTDISSVSMGGALPINLDDPTSREMMLDFCLMMLMFDSADRRLTAQTSRLKENQDTLGQGAKFLAEARMNMNEAAAMDGRVTWGVNHNTNEILLDNGYKIKIDNRNMSWRLYDEKGNQMNVWGDPHVNESDGGTWDFKAGATFVLRDGTKISVGTKPWGNMTVSDTLTITKGTQAITVTGIANNRPQISDVSLRGRALDAQTNDGHIFYQGDGVDDWFLADTEQEIDAAGTGGREQVAWSAKQQELSLEMNDVEMSREMERFLKANGIKYNDSDQDGHLTAQEWNEVSQNIEAFMNRANSSSRIDMGVWELLSGRYDSLYDRLLNDLAPKLFGSNR